jgi:trimethylamine--corrinoid protein Co-methyltransferase
MAETQVRTRRQGGREARKALRAAPIVDADKAVRPGLVGGLFKPLSESEVERIHEASIEVLETIGLANSIPSCVELITKAGGTYTDEERLLFPRSLVEDALNKACRGFTLYGQDPKHDLDLSSQKFYFGTAGAAVHLVDPRTREYKDSTLLALYNAARVVDRMEHIHYFQRSMIPRDMTDPRDMDFNSCYASVMGTTKHVGTSWVEPEHLEESFKMRTKD